MGPFFVRLTLVSFASRDCHSDSGTLAVTRLLTLRVGHRLPQTRFHSSVPKIRRKTHRKPPAILSSNQLSSSCPGSHFGAAHPGAVGKVVVRKYRTGEQCALGNVEPSVQGPKTGFDDSVSLPFVFSRAGKAAGHTHVKRILYIDMSVCVCACASGMFLFGFPGTRVSGSSVRTAVRKKKHLNKI